MNSNIDFKELWNRQESSIPDVKELYDKANKYKRKHWIKLLLMNFLMIFTAVLMIYIWITYHPEFITTKIGIVSVIFSIFLVLFFYNQIGLLLKKSDYQLEVNEYLKQLFKIKQKQVFLQTRVLSVYFILLSVGLCLYLYEYTSGMSTILAIITYGFTLSWIAFNWFYLRPKIIKKQQKELSDLIEKFKKANQELE
jgi:uncharacterized membrane protein YciS (DUF1049 family)